MRKYIINYITLIISFLLLYGFTSCEKEIDVDLHSVEPRIVIEGLIAQDSLAKVSITTTKDFNTDNSFPPIYGAIVTITDDEGNNEVLSQNKEGLYVARYMIGRVNKTYNLEVKIEQDVYNAVSKMPERTPIEYIKMYYFPSFGYAVPMVVFNDPPGIDNYYRAKLYLNGKRMDIGDEGVDATHQDGILIERILPVFDNDKEDSRKVEKGDTVMVELQSIEKGVFTFFDSLSRMESGQTNPTNNITGGALGYFSAYSFDRMTTIADW